MKKQVLLFLALFLVALSGRSQSISTSSYACSPNFTCGITGTVSGATSYTWSVVPSTSLNAYGTVAIITGNTPSQVYTVTCLPYNGSTAMMSSIMTTTVQYNGINYFSIINSAGNNTICAGTTLTLSASAPGSYTWYPGTVNASSIVVTPTANISYAVINSNGSCSYSTAIAIYVVGMPSANVNTPSSFSTCSSAVNNVIASGAGTYTWTGPTGTYYSSAISATAVGCYSLTAANACGTATNQVCVTSVGSAPSVTVSGYVSNICAGNTVTLTASGAASYTWSGTWNNTMSNTVTSSPTVAFTPTTGAYACFSLQATNGGGCIVNSAYCSTVSGTANLTISGPTVYCSNTGIGSLTAAGAVSYTWNTGSNAATINFVPSASTCFTVTGTTSCGNTISATRCISTMASPTITVSGNMTMCPNSPNVFSASGANSYTWVTVNGATFLGTGSILTLANPTCFVVYGYNSNGCSASSGTICPVASPGATITASANASVVCAGDTVTLNANGGVSYLWSNNVTGASQVINPTSSQCYTVIGTNASGCSQSAVVCVLVNGGPGNGNPVNTNLCAGQSAVLTAASSNAYSWSTGANTQTISVSPSSSTCYTATGYNSAGCPGSTVHCVNILASQNLSISGSNTVCLGSSITLTANGGVVYQWSGGPMSNTINILPTSSTVAVVSSTLPSTGCVSSASMAITVNTSCSDVWPGDANSDGAVSSSDVLELGLAASSTGPARSPGGNSWNAQYASNWSGTISTGKNKAHADCNGDGTVNANDTLAIYNNFALTHSFRPGAASDPDVSLSCGASNVFVNDWNTVDVQLGNSTTPSYQIYGISFDLSFESSMLYPDEVYLEFANSNLNSGSPILFRKRDFGPGFIYSAIVRTDHADVNCGGKIASLKFRVSTLADENADFIVKVHNAKMVTANGNLSPLNGGEIHLPVSRATALREFREKANFSMQPNPASGFMTLSNQAGETVNFVITDLTGRVLTQGSFSGETQINTSNLSAGVYIVNVKAGDSQVQKKLVIDK